MKFYRKEIFTIPNILTYIRILCIPFFIWLMLDETISPHHIMIALGVFMFASLTDMVDGYIARQYHLTSDIGKVADPIADKLLQIATLICLTINGYIPFAIPIIFFCKEFYLVLGGSIIVKIFKSEYSLQANIFGKCATMFNTFGLFLGFFVEYANSAYKIAVAIILYIGAAFSIITAIIYSYQYLQFRKVELGNISTQANDIDFDENLIVDATVNEVDDANVADTIVTDNVAVVQTANVEEVVATTNSSVTNNANE